MSEAIFNFDANILLWLQNNVRGPLDAVMTFITHLGDKGLLWIALAIIMICVRKTRKVGVASAISIAIGFIVANLILKNWIARIRPYVLIDDLILMIEEQHDFSFPSGHTTNSLACAWVMFRWMDKKYGIPALVMALLISFSRLYVGVHYPTDVLVGLVIGIASAEAAMVIVKALRKRFPAFKDFTRSKRKKKRRVQSRG